MLGVSAFVAGGTILLGAWGCGSEPKPTTEPSKQAQATEAPAPQPAAAADDAQMHAMIDRTAPETAPAVQPKDTVKTEATPPATHAAPVIHVVKRGETLSSISQQYYGTKANWKLILDANPTVVKSANDLRPNMKLVIPPAKTTPVKVGAIHSPAKSGTMLSATTTAPAGMP